MAIPESQLDTWSVQGSVTQSAATYQAIRDALRDERAPFASQRFEIFLQGSYGNKTNIWADSDVDVVIRLDSVYYSDTNYLTQEDKANYDRNFVKADYTYSEFKKQIIDWLTFKFGSKVRPGKKAIFVPGNSSRRDCDVLAAVENRDYFSYPATGSPGFREGIAFWTPEGQKIVNYPKQHAENCISKNRDTLEMFKPTVRVFKNMRNRMIDDGYIQPGVAPSYFIEGMLSNVHPRVFDGSFRTTVVNCINATLASDRSQLTCANGIHYLLREGQPVCWDPSDFETYMNALTQFWSHW